MRIEFNKELSIYFKVKGYQFPNMTDDPYGYDMNWLNIEVTIKRGNKSWSQTDPFMLTLEIEELADWLNNIKDHIGDQWFCMENILFIKSIESAVIPDGSCQLRLEINALHKLEESGCMVFEKIFTSREIAEIVRELKEVLSQFPIRGDSRIQEKVRKSIGFEK